MLFLIHKFQHGLAGRPEIEGWGEQASSQRSGSRMDPMALDAQPGSRHCEVTTTTLKLRPKSLPLSLTSCHLLYSSPKNSPDALKPSQTGLPVTFLFCWIILPVSESETLKSLWSPSPPTIPSPQPTSLLTQGPWPLTWTASRLLVSISLAPDLLRGQFKYSLLSPNHTTSSNWSPIFLLQYILYSLENCAKTPF